MPLKLMAAAKLVPLSAGNRQHYTVNRAVCAHAKTQLHTVAALIRKYRAAILELIGFKIREVLIPMEVQP